MGWWILAGLALLAFVRRPSTAGARGTTLPADATANASPVLVDMSNDMVNPPIAVYRGLEAPPSRDGFYVAHEEIRYWHDLASAARARDCARMHELSNLHA